MDFLGRSMLLDQENREIMNYIKWRNGAEYFSIDRTIDYVKNFWKKIGLKGRHG